MEKKRKVFRVFCWVVMRLLLDRGVGYKKSCGFLGISHFTFTSPSVNNQVHSSI
jgi:hypothetical protein